jgi:acyl-CoA dehydrogenase
MNFDFSEEAKELRTQSMRFMSEESSMEAVRRVLDGKERFDRRLWAQMANLGWLGVSIPESHGGLGLNDEMPCVLAESFGRSLGTVPLPTSMYIATQFIVAAGSDEQKDRYLPRLAEGSLVASFAWAEGLGEPDASQWRCSQSGGVLQGVKAPVLDGGIADIAVVAARDGGQGMGLFIVDLNDPRVERTRQAGIDPTRDVASLRFNAVPADRLETPDAEGLLRDTLDRAAILTAFEQIGGAQRSLEMACEYASQRQAFGRVIGSYQGIKHPLAKAMIAIELARSNAYLGALILGGGAGDLATAACTARITASEAFNAAAAANLQTHGGMGYTWESDCHLFFRRARLLSLSLGSPGWWKDRLAEQLIHQGETNGLQ